MSHCVKVMGIYVNFAMTTKQIWSCLVTVPSNSEKNYFWPNFISHFRKSYQIWGELAQEQKSYRQKQIEGGNTPSPVLIGLNPIDSIKVIYMIFTKLNDLCILKIFTQPGLWQAVLPSKG